MSKKKFDRLEVLLGVQSGRLRVAARLRITQSEAAPGVSVAGRFETRRRGQASNNRLPAVYRGLALSLRTIR
ncbi:MAG: hypothetical protein ACREE9_09585 [Stellaceae bacterium]